MYNFRIETELGNSVFFGPEYGIVADLDPLSGIDVELSTSQGFQQMGETIDSQSVSGLYRTIKGVVFKDEDRWAGNLLKALPVFTSGKLYFEDSYYCHITISKTPTIVRSKEGKLSFMLQVFCTTPFWYYAKSMNQSFGGYLPAFRFPVNYAEPHRFGVKTSIDFVNCYNEGTVVVPFSVRFVSTATVSGFGLINIYTGQQLKINDTLSYGEEVIVEFRNNILVVEKIQGSKITDIFSLLDENSELFRLNVGDNLLSVIADAGRDDLITTISFEIAVMGVLA